MYFRATLLAYAVDRNMASFAEKLTSGVSVYFHKLRKRGIRPGKKKNTEDTTKVSAEEDARCTLYCVNKQIMGFCPYCSHRAFAVSIKADFDTTLYCTIHTVNTWHSCTWHISELKYLRCWGTRAKKKGAWFKRQERKRLKSNINEANDAFLNSLNIFKRAQIKELTMYNSTNTLPSYLSILCTPST